MDALWGNEVWRVSILAFLVGLAAGAMVVYAAFRPEHARRRQLQAEVERLEGELKAYRQEVNQHFHRTSELFETLTSSYRVFYDHLASGARRLCREERLVPALDIPQARLLGQPDEGRPPPEPAAGETGPRREAGEPAVSPSETGGESTSEASRAGRGRPEGAGPNGAPGGSSAQAPHPA